jgi:hypothetical protein
MVCIKKKYNISSYWNGSAYCGLTLDWDYKNRTVDLSMPSTVHVCAMSVGSHPGLVSDSLVPELHIWSKNMESSRNKSALT